MNKNDKKDYAEAGAQAQSRDVNSKRIFENQVLCAQFLREYSGMDLFKDVQPEDIEKVPLRYHMFDEVEQQADSVSRVWLKHREGEIAGKSDRRTEVPWYIVPLIDHKSSVDYNICMQLLRYMICIWTDWQKEHGAKSRRKDFLYPPILPIVYYEGTARWTAGMHLRDRVYMSDLLGDYLPDFTYHVVRLHDYSDEELLEKRDEMSLLMLLNKIQRPEDMTALRELAAEDMNAVVKSSSEQVVDIIAATVASLCRKMNLPEEEQREYISKVRERDMGYLFENMEPMDIQAERAKTKAEKERADHAEERADHAEERADHAEDLADHAVMLLIFAYLEQHLSWEAIREKLMSCFGMDGGHIQELMAKAHELCRQEGDSLA